MYEDKKEIKKFDSQTGGDSKKDQIILNTSIGKDPAEISIEYLNTYLEAFKKEKESFKKTLEDISKLDTKATELAEKFKELKKDQNRSNSFMMWGTGIIVGVFFITGVIISIDYFFSRGNDNKYFINQVDLTKQNFYSKEEIDSKLNENKLLNDFKNCILQNQGYWPCLK